MGVCRSCGPATSLSKKRTEFSRAKPLSQLRRSARLARRLPGPRLLRNVLLSQATHQ